MANELNLALNSTGLITLVARIFDHNWAQLGGDLAMTEVGGATGRYTGSVPAVTLATQEYEVLFYDTTPAPDEVLGQGTLLWDAQGDKEVRDEVIAIERWKDRGLDLAAPKLVTELVRNKNYDESTPGIAKEVRKVGAVTTITRI